MEKDKTVVDKAHAAGKKEDNQAKKEPAPEREYPDLGPGRTDPNTGKTNEAPEGQLKHLGPIQEQDKKTHDEIKRGTEAIDKVQKEMEKPPKSPITTLDVAKDEKKKTAHG